MFKIVARLTVKADKIDEFKNLDIAMLERTYLVLKK